MEDGVANPTGRRLWGWQLEGTSVMTQRTALCVTAAGHLYYAWGEEIDGPTLGKALRQAGCSYAMHLDMNPAHAGFVYTDVVKPEEGRVPPQAGRRTDDDPAREIRALVGQRLFSTSRSATRPPHDASGLSWAVDNGTQATPSWLPGVYTSQLTLGSVQVDLLSFEPGHVEFRFRAGYERARPSSAPGLKTGQDDATEHRVMAAIGLGHTTESTRYGFAFGSQAVIPLRAGYATLVLSPIAPPRIEAPGVTPTLTTDEEAVQLPLLVETANSNREHVNAGTCGAGQRCASRPASA